MRPPIKVREASEPDWGFIRDGWRATFFQVGQAFQGADKAHCYEEMSRLFARLMPTARAVVACDITDEATTVAFAVHTGPELHYMYVQKDFRRHGLPALMLDGLGIKRYTFRTLMGDRWLRATKPGWAFTPRFTI